MHLFFSIITAIISLYYLDTMSNSYNADTTYTFPVIVLLVYSVLNVVRDFKKTWLVDDDCYEKTRYTYYGNNRSVNRYDNEYYNGTKKVTTVSSTGTRSTEQTEYFSQDSIPKRDNTKQLVHYPTKSEVSNRIAEIENDKWFRTKRDIASVFGYDLTEKYRRKFKEPVNVSSRGKVKCLNKEDGSRFMPNNTWLQETLKKENDEYNAVTKRMGRSCEISFAEIEQEEIENG